MRSQDEELFGIKERYTDTGSSFLKLLARYVALKNAVSENVEQSPTSPTVVTGSIAEKFRPQIVADVCKEHRQERSQEVAKLDELIEKVKKLSEVNDTLNGSKEQILQSSVIFREMRLGMPLEDIEATLEKGTAQHATASGHATQFVDARGGWPEAPVCALEGFRQLGSAYDAATTRQRSDIKDVSSSSASPGLQAPPLLPKQSLYASATFEIPTGLADAKSDLVETEGKHKEYTSLYQSQDRMRSVGRQDSFLQAEVRTIEDCKQSEYVDDACIKEQQCLTQDDGSPFSFQDFSPSERSSTKFATIDNHVLQVQSSFIDIAVKPKDATSQFESNETQSIPQIDADAIEVQTRRVEREAKLKEGTIPSETKADTQSIDTEDSLPRAEVLTSDVRTGPTNKMLQAMGRTLEHEIATAVLNVRTQKRRDSESCLVRILKKRQRHVQHAVSSSASRSTVVEAVDTETIPIKSSASHETKDAVHLTDTKDSLARAEVWTIEDCEQGTGACSAGTKGEEAPAQDGASTPALPRLQSCNPCVYCESTLHRASPPGVSAASSAPKSHPNSRVNLTGVTQKQSDHISHTSPDRDSFQSSPASSHPAQASSYRWAEIICTPPASPGRDSQPFGSRSQNDRSLDSSRQGQMSVMPDGPIEELEKRGHQSPRVDCMLLPRNMAFQSSSANTPYRPRARSASSSMRSFGVAREQSLVASRTDRPSSPSDSASMCHGSRLRSGNVTPCTRGFWSDGFWQGSSAEDSRNTGQASPKPDAVFPTLKKSSCADRIILPHLMRRAASPPASANRSHGQQVRTASPPARGFSNSVLCHDSLLGCNPINLTYRRGPPKIRQPSALNEDIGMRLGIETPPGVVEISAATPPQDPFPSKVSYALNGSSAPLIRSSSSTSVNRCPSPSHLIRSSSSTFTNRCPSPIPFLAPSSCPPGANSTLLHNHYCGLAAFAKLRSTGTNVADLSLLTTCANVAESSRPLAIATVAAGNVLPRECTPRAASQVEELSPRVSAAAVKSAAASVLIAKDVAATNRVPLGVIAKAAPPASVSKDSQLLASRSPEMEIDNLQEVTNLESMKDAFDPLDACEKDCQASESMNSAKNVLGADSNSQRAHKIIEKHFSSFAIDQRSGITPKMRTTAQQP